MRLVMSNGTLLENRDDRALGNIERAVDAVIRFDGQEMGPFTACVGPADLDAVRVFAHDAAIGHDEGHRIFVVTAWQSQ
jgi:hypothetical protein